MSTADREPKTIRVVVAEEHPSIRQNLRYVLDAERDMVCVGVASDGREALDLTIREVPDVLVIDAELRDLDGIDVAIRLRRLAPAVRTILYGTEPTVPELARRAQLAGFVAKGAPLEELLTAIRRAAFAARTQSLRTGGR
jgi:DNA-binding NarL/FixJ family response regulator